MKPIAVEISTGKNRVGLLAELGSNSAGMAATTSAYLVEGFGFGDAQTPAPGDAGDGAANVITVDRDLAGRRDRNENTTRQN